MIRYEKWFVNLLHTSKWKSLNPHVFYTVEMISIIHNIVITNIIIFSDSFV